MADKRRGDYQASITLPRASAFDLRGRQSVRATFKLTEGCIEAISIVATQLGIKKKSLFDHLVEDVQALNSIARELRNRKAHPASPTRVQKTYVISRKSLSSLDEVSRHYNAPRDALVEYSAQRLLPIILKEREKHETRKQLLKEITHHLGQGLELQQKIAAKLGADDPIWDRFDAAMSVYENAYRSISDFIDRSKGIEDFDPEMLKRYVTSRR